MSLRQDVARAASPANTTAGAAGVGPVRIWLFAVAGLIFAMVLVGGATRLTESGLSITEWAPVTGAMPPLSAAAWRDAFAAYKQIPQYHQLFPDMTLSEFKVIYLWEWGHRLLARLLGAAFILPLLLFWRRGRLRGRLGKQLLVPTALLALEPIVGWWMVASGLSERVEVSQYRLAAHLLIATAAFGALLWIAVGLRRTRSPAAGARFRVAGGIFCALVFCQIGVGALVAGLRAGLADNSWPLMDGRLIPSGLWALTPWWRNLFEDGTSVQFEHRALGYVIVAFALGQALAAARAGPASPLARRAMGLAALAFAQAAIGVATLILVVPIGAGLLHQAFAMLLFGAAVAHWRSTLPA
ncbi:MAG TPA: COX15/CtaA family protein [Roseiarcus sp.]|nr:COX15/CtaA family protein [Roseiarcus sp.]